MPEDQDGPPTLPEAWKSAPDGPSPTPAHLHEIVEAARGFVQAIGVFPVLKARESERDAIPPREGMGVAIAPVRRLERALAPLRDSGGFISCRLWPTYAGGQLRELNRTFDAILSRWGWRSMAGRKVAGSGGSGSGVGRRFVLAGELETLNRLIDCLTRLQPLGRVAIDPEPPTTPGPSTKIPEAETEGGKLKIQSRAIAAALDLKKEGLPVTIKAACERAKVDRSHLTKRYPDTVKAIRAIAAPDRVGRRPRGYRTPETGEIEAYQDED